MEKGPFEQSRLNEVEELALRTTSQDDEAFDKSVKILHELSKREITTVTVVLESLQMFKAKRGLDVTQTPRAYSICAQIMHETNMVEIPDLRQDPRFAQNHLVKKSDLKSYTAVPLVSSRGFPIGALCAVGVDTGLLRTSAREEIAGLANDVMATLERRRRAELHVPAELPLKVRPVIVSELLNQAGGLAQQILGSSIAIDISGPVDGRVLCQRYIVAHEIALLIKEGFVHSGARRCAVTIFRQDGLCRVSVGCGGRRANHIDLRLSP